MNVGTKKYKDFFLEKENFLNYEKQKIDRYINYEQYGAYGFRVLFEPSPLVIFFSSAFLSLEGTIDTKEIVNISINYKGKSIFATNGAFGDFSSMFYAFGSLLMLAFGLNSFYGFGFSRFADKMRSKGRGNGTASILLIIFSRLLCLNGFFSGVILTAYITAAIKGIHFSAAGTGIFALFCIYMLLFINLFFFFGLLFAVLFSFKRSFFITVYGLWFVSCFFLPEINRIDLEQRAHAIKSNEAVNIRKLNNLMKFEQRYKSVIDTLKEKKVKNLKGIFKGFLDEYMKNEYRLNKDIENSLGKEVNKLIYYNEKKAVISPSTFYLFLAKEVSSYSYSNYRLFLKYILSLKDDFSHYFFDRRYSKIGQPVEPFIKGEENVFKTGCTLPGNFWPGLWLTLFWSLLLLCGSLRIFEKRLAAADKKPGKAKEGAVEIDIDRMEKGKTYFSLCRDNAERENTLRYLSSRGAAIIEKLNIDDFDPGISLKAWLRHECNKRGIEPAGVLTGVEKAGISSRLLKSKLKTLRAEVLNRVYLEIKLSEEFGMFAFDDFLRDVSKQFENEFKERVKEMGNRVTFLYIGSEMFDINVKKREMPGEDCRFFIVDMDNISLR